VRDGGSAEGVHVLCSFAEWVAGGGAQI
jgi:hypothetical protein